MNLDRVLPEKKKKIVIGVMFLVLLILQFLVLLYFGARKSGFHEDEFYSYYSTNKTAGLSVNDRTWLPRDSYRNDFVVLEGEEFRYDVVKMMQSWDVHPPLYYYILHTVCSLFPGVFSKWLGISVNLIAFVPCFLLLAYLVYNSVVTGGGEEEKRKGILLSFLTCLAWGFSAAVVSGVMFIRMYQWLTLFVLLCACLHIRAIRKNDYGFRFLIPLGITVFLGFLTQYYYIIFHFFMGVGFCFLLLKEKRIRNLLAYVFSCGFGFFCAVLYYPASLSHIFRGYRGTEAVSEFSNAANTLERLKFFVSLFDKYVVNGTLAVIILLICLLWITVFYREKRKPEKGMGLLLFTCAGYFFTISKTALLLGETSNRYQLPIYGVLVFFLLYFLYVPAEMLINRYIGEKSRQIALKWNYGILLLLFAAVLFIDVTALRETKVFFLYEEEKPVMEYVKENCDVPVIVFYNGASPDNVWRLSDELMEFPEIYLASQENREKITDEKLTKSDRLLVYVADHEDKEECLNNLLQSSESLSEYHVVAEKNLWTLYEMN